MNGHEVCIIIKVMDIYEFLRREVRYLKGVGPKRAQLFKKLGIVTVLDLLYFAPRRYIDRRSITPIHQVRRGEEVTVAGKVLMKGTKKVRKNLVFTVVISDGTDWMELVWRNVRGIEKVFNKGDQVIASGRAYVYRGTKVIYHPEYEIIDDNKQPAGSKILAGMLVPVYPSTEGLKPRFIRKLILDVLETVGNEIPETLPDYIRNKFGLYSRKDALHLIHFPRDLKEARVARKTLVFEELFYFYIKLLEKRVESKGLGIPLQVRNELTGRFFKLLKFELTGAQKRVIAEITEDMGKNAPMHRLLQGDVGSGKTVVALYTMLVAVENGYQAVMMAPTEILAEQHFLVMSEYLIPLNVKIALLLGKMKKKDKELSLERIRSGDADITIGTHALIQDDVEFKKLAVAVIDEQHKFGVLQRAKLLEKGYENKSPHFLVMTATPIPRTLALTVYGDLDVSVIDEMPPGRGNIVTKWVRESRRDRVYSWLFDEVKKGNQAYVVAPLIEKSDKLEAEAATELYEKLKNMAPEGIKIGLIHGKMKKDERGDVMRMFRNGEFHILVATTVIEVGIDVPNATIMIIEHAERFGLAQLHQLRGRIGRGSKKSYCILITPSKVSEDAKRRLKAMVETTDGFKIAEIDLEIRGPGEISGTRQHGLPRFRIANLVRDQKIIQITRSEVEKILEFDPFLTKPQNRIIKETLANEKIGEVIYVG